MPPHTIGMRLLFEELEKTTDPKMRLSLLLEISKREAKRGSGGRPKGSKNKRPRRKNGTILPNPKPETPEESGVDWGKVIGGE